MVEEPSLVKQLSPKPRVWSRVKRYYPMSLQFLLKTYKAFFFLFSSWAFQILLHPPTENLFLFTLWKLWCVFFRAAFAIFMLDQAVYTYVHTESCLLSESWKYTQGSNSWVKSRQNFPPYYSQSPQYLALRFLFLSTHTTSCSFYTV
jgi:hypothetical protein